MPAMDEGDLLYMPSAQPGLSAGKAAELLQQTDRMIRTVPEVATVLGKAGRAETATDPAPLEMFETTIQFKPRDQWRVGMTPAKLVEELDRTVRVPGLTNVWVPPIRNRIDMLATGIKSPIGVKVAGSNLAEMDRIAASIERVARTVPGVSSALAERLTGGAMSMSTSIGRPRGAMASTSPMCRRSCRAQSGARRSARRSRALPATRSASATLASCATAWRACGPSRS
jgi:Putative silver efflux pump